MKIEEDYSRGISAKSLKIGSTKTVKPTQKSIKIPKE
jgi:hypothetical protein